MITTCTACGSAYEAGSEEQANEPRRYCFACRRMTYADRVRQLEAEGLTTSDAQAVADAEQMRGRRFAFDPNHILDNLASVNPSDAWRVTPRFRKGSK